MHVEGAQPARRVHADPDAARHRPRAARNHPARGGLLGRRRQASPLARPGPVRARTGGRRPPAARGRRCRRQGRDRRRRPEVFPRRTPWICSSPASRRWSPAPPPASASRSPRRSPARVRGSSSMAGPRRVSADAIAAIAGAHASAQLEPLAADLGTPEGAELAIERFPDVAILVNNLGIFEPRPFEEIRDDEWAEDDRGQLHERGAPVAPLPAAHEGSGTGAGSSSSPRSRR